MVTCSMVQRRGRPHGHTACAPCTPQQPAPPPPTRSEPTTRLPSDLVGMRLHCPAPPLPYQGPCPAGRAREGWWSPGGGRGGRFGGRRHLMEGRSPGECGQEVGHLCGSGHPGEVGAGVGALEGGGRHPGGAGGGRALEGGVTLGEQWEVHIGGRGRAAGIGHMPGCEGSPCWPLRLPPHPGPLPLPLPPTL